VAAEDSELAVIGAEVFRHLLRESDEMALHMLQEFSRRISRTNAALDELAQSRTQIVLLLHLIRRWPQTATVAALAGITESDPSDVLAVLEHLDACGVLQLRDERVVHFDPEKAWILIAELSSSHSETTAARHLETGGTR